MPESLASIETELRNARRDLRQVVAEIDDKAAAFRAEVYPTAIAIGIGFAASLGFMIGRKKHHALAPLVFVAAGYCGMELLRRSRKRRMP